VVEREVDIDGQMSSRSTEAGVGDQGKFSMKSN
jgi:hypothetical protein